MKKVLFLLLLTVNLFGQTQKTNFRGIEHTQSWNEWYLSVDTVGELPNGYIITFKEMISYFYNDRDSILVQPQYYVPKNKKAGVYSFKLIAFNIWIPMGIDNVSSAELVVWCRDNGIDKKGKLLKDKPTREKNVSYCPFYATYNKENPNSLEYGDRYTGILVEANEQIAFTSASMAGTKEIKLTVNGRVLVPEQKRNNIQYFGFAFGTLLDNAYAKK